METVLSKKLEKKINTFALEILQEHGLKKLWLVNDSLFIFNADYGIYEPIDSNGSRYTVQVKHAFGKYVADKLQQKIDSIKENIDHQSKKSESNIVAVGENITPDVVSKIKRYYSNRIIKAIGEKIITNRLLFASSNVKPYRVVIPLMRVNCIDTLSSELVYPKELKSTHYATSILKLKIDKVCSIDSICPYKGYYEFIKELYPKAHLFRKVKQLLVDISVNVPFFCNRIYFISVKNKELLRLFLEPIESLIPSEFWSHIGIDKIKKSNLAWTYKKFNVVDCREINISKHLKFIQDYFVDLKIYTMTGKNGCFNIKNRTLQIFLITPEQVLEVKKQFTDNQYVEYIDLPDDTEVAPYIKRLIESEDSIELLKMYSESILKLICEDLNNESDCIEEVEKELILNWEDEFWKNKVEITGHPKDLVSKQELHAQYTEFCHKNGVTPKSDGTISKIIMAKTEFLKGTTPTAFINLTEEERANHFVEGTGGINSAHPKTRCWFGIKLKS